MSMATGAPGAVTDGLCCMGHCTRARGSCTAPEPVTFLLEDPFALVLACRWLAAVCEAGMSARSARRPYSERAVDDGRGG